MAITATSDSLTPRVADAAEYLLHDLDLRDLVRRFRMANPNINAELVVQEYRRFLVLKHAFFDEDATLLSPSPLIDQVWHTHILDTKSYIAMCLALGMWIHHSPSGASDRDAGNRTRRQQNTTDCYRARFGEINLDVWDMEGWRRPLLDQQAPSRTATITVPTSTSNSEHCPAAAVKRRRTMDSSGPADATTPSAWHSARTALPSQDANSSAASSPMSVPPSTSQANPQPQPSSPLFKLTIVDKVDGREADFNLGERGERVRFKNLAKAYAKHRKVAVDRLVFEFDSDSIEWDARETCDDLGLVSGDTVFVHVL